MDCGKWTKISFDVKPGQMHWLWHQEVLNYICKTDLKLKRVYNNWYMAIFCGSKKHNQIIKEINLLGYEDETYIW